MERYKFQRFQRLRGLAALPRNGTKLDLTKRRSIDPSQNRTKKCLISDKKYIRALRFSIWQIISWIKKKEREIKFEQLEDDSEPQLFNFYIHPERKYNINKDYTVQNKIKQISTRRSSYVCFPTTFSQLRTQNCVLYTQLCQSYMFSLKRNQTPNSVVTWRGC